MIKPEKMKMNFKASVVIVKLLSKVITGTATVEEEQTIKEWREADIANERLFAELSDAQFWREQGKRRQPDFVMAYFRIHEKCRKRKQRRLFRRVAVAAVILLPLCVSIGFWIGGLGRNPGQLQDYTLQSMNASIYPGQVKAELLLADGSKIHLDGKSKDSLTDQAGNVILVEDNGLSYRDARPVKELMYNQLRIPRGGEYSLKLNDGTIVYLNSETELTYPVQFIGPERRVKLSGEAYFEVAHNTAQPFIVEIAHSEVKVLGTSFNLRSYEDEQEVATTLVNGKVCFVTDRQEKMDILPGQQVVLDANGHLTKKEVNTYLYTAWVKGKFIFRKQRLEDIMAIVSRWYNVEIIFGDSRAKEVSFSGGMFRYEGFEALVKMIEATGSIRCTIRGNTIIINSRK